MNKKNLILSLVLCGATGLATGQMMPNGSAQPTMPGQSPTGQPGRPGTLGGEIPNTVGGTGNGQTNPNAGTPTPKVDDPTLERDVKQQLASDPAFAMVQVAAHNGRIDLTGSVSSKDDRKKAKDMAKSVPGVTSVKEHLTIGGGASPTGAAMGAGTGQNTAGSISGNAQKSNADSGNMNATPSASDPGATSQPGNPPQSTAPEANPKSTPPPNDTTPHARATTPGGSGGRLINVAYQDGGKQATPAQEQGQSTGATPNGTQVNITMAPESADNGTLQAQIENALRNEPALGASHVQVNVTDTVIELAGTVGSSKDKLAAERIAQSFGANRRLSDKLTVTGHGHSDMAQDHPAMNNSGTGNAANQNPTQPH